MRISVLQTNVKWAQPKANQETANQLISKAAHSDLYVLPEMWTTGFAVKPQDIESEDGIYDSLQWMIRAAQAGHCAICGSVLAKTGKGEYRNRLYFVKSDGTYLHYDKHHLFTYGGEDKFYTAGSERAVVEYMGVRFLLQVCYDLRFPLWQRNDEDYDAIIFTANWPASRQNVWQVLLRARAIENQCYVIGANRVGKDPVCTYIGRSTIIDAKGKTLVQARGDMEQSITTDIDLEELLHFRSKFPVLKDRDKFKLY
ncbi:MAG: nitrilase family protein [Prevotella sp.]|nr:nitrilase family protein [Prevotella sp.]